MIMAFEITRHGARYGLHSDYFNETSPAWRPGELTQNGKRQHYLIGSEMRNRYMVKNALLDPLRYRASEVYVRSTDRNRTIESALSQLLGLYPLGHSLDDNQTSSALPTISVS